MSAGSRDALARRGRASIETCSLARGGGDLIWSWGGCGWPQRTSQGRVHAMTSRSSVAAAFAAAIVVAVAAHVASAAPILPGHFLPGASVITFETGSTAEPVIPGVHFID